jgi:hypothetical protein
MKGKVDIQSLYSLDKKQILENDIFKEFSKIVKKKKNFFSEKELGIDFLDAVFNEGEHKDILNKIICSKSKWKELFEVCYENSHKPRILMEDGSYYKDPKDKESSKMLALNIYKDNYLWKTENDPV